MTRYEIPLTATPQRFSIAMVGVTYQMLLKWNAVSQCWVLDISDANGVGLVFGIPLVTGADLLAQYTYLEFGCELIAQTDGDITAPPAFNNLGVTAHLYFDVP